MKTAVEELLTRYPQRLWRAQAQQPRGPLQDPGHEDVRDLLGGWPRGAITEIHSQVEGIGELRLLLPTIAALSQQEKRWVLWCLPPYVPYAPALAAAGVRLDRMLVLHPRQRQDQLWALESALRSGTCSAVLAWPPALEEGTQRRLQLAAEAGNCMGFFFFRDRQSARSTAALRLRLQPAGEQVCMQVEKRRGASLPAAANLELPLAI
ncbi:translesion DNA synthesis-associated protein ImuA [Candidatus Igneacidithiobacillus taiwanensis]|uniref:translesion DNA synthesis-associated protein ImuA n=1 Tax=Candidatus Igneacidithiobacillus taiwanensis TaxID=1945924 RepID=UPI0028A0414D|nr:translesion DNA synthesis-associated protein ImuA [Candidatus Igneacidithiobacillus taiwanensis]MCE5359861.1 translesion DNA synthesis-associated protein ImuA [Acidithiobacillus sp.]